MYYSYRNENKSSGNEPSETKSSKLKNLTHNKTKTKDVCALAINLDSLFMLNLNSYMIDDNISYDDTLSTLNILKTFNNSIKNYINTGKDENIDQDNTKKYIDLLFNANYGIIENENEKYFENNVNLLNDISKSYDIYLITKLILIKLKDYFN